MTQANQDIGFDPARPMIRGDDHTVRASITIPANVPDWLDPATAVYVWLEDEPSDKEDQTPVFAISLAAMTLEETTTGISVTIPIPGALTSSIPAFVYYHELELVSATGRRGTAFTGRAKLTPDA